MKFIVTLFVLGFIFVSLHVAISKGISKLNNFHFIVIVLGIIYLLTN